jgi:hypothetical protein
MERWKLKMRNVSKYQVNRFSLRLILVSLLLTLSFISISLGEEVDRMVAIVNGKDLITRSDLLWQLALQPNQPLERPDPNDLDQVLQLIIDQILIAQEAEKLPPTSPTDEEVKEKLNELIKYFPSRANLEERMHKVGLSSERLMDILKRRVAIEKYLDFRFRSFTVVTPGEVADYYRDVYVPRLRRQNPGVIVPKLEEVRDQLEKDLTETKIESEVDTFLENARQRADIVVLDR